MIEVWTLPKKERKRIEKWRKNLQNEITKAIDEVIRCQNELNTAIHCRESFKDQLTLLDTQFKFDS